jgi:hypothetical protein
MARGCRCYGCTLGILCIIIDQLVPFCRTLCSVANIGQLCFHQRPHLICFARFFLIMFLQFDRFSSKSVHTGCLKCYVFDVAWYPPSWK